jgi:ribosome assembly protein SQT1
MSGAPEDVVQQLDPTRTAEDEDFLGEDDVLEVEEMEEDGMDVGSDEEAGEGDDGGEERGDDAEAMLDAGLDDSVVSYAGHEDAIFAVALHPVDPLIAVSGGADDMGHIWRTDTGAEIVKMGGHTDSVTSVGFSFDGEMVATGGMDGRVSVWRRVKGSEGYLNWEFLISLEGPDEVNVSLDLHCRDEWGTDAAIWDCSGLTGTPRETSSSVEQQTGQSGSGSVSSDDCPV